MASPGKLGSKRVHRGHDFAVEGASLGEVVGDDPALDDDLGVDGQQHDATAGDPPHLGQPGIEVLPVVDRQHAHRRIDALVAERQRLGDAFHGRARPRRPLGDHHRRGLDRDDVAVGRLVGPGAGADVDDAAGVAERGPDRRLDAWVGTAEVAVVDAHPVVGRIAHRPCSRRSVTSSSTKSP